MSPVIATVVMVVFGALMLVGFRIGVEMVSRDGRHRGAAPVPRPAVAARPANARLPQDQRDAA